MSDRSADVLDLTRQLIAIESHEEAPGQEKAVVEYAAGRLNGEGIPVELVPVVDGRCNLIARLAGSEGSPVLVLNGHTDTVPPYAMPDPFVPRILDDRICGRGSADIG